MVESVSNNTFIAALLGPGASRPLRSAPRSNGIGQTTPVDPQDRTTYSQPVDKIELSDKATALYRNGLINGKDAATSQVGRAQPDASQVGRALPDASGGIDEASGRARPTLPNDQPTHDASPALGPSTTQDASAAQGAPTTQRASTTEDASTTPLGGKELSTEEEAQVRELKQRDQEVRRHEQTHKSAAGQHATGAPSFEYQTGPDGKRYAVGGEVSIDTSEVSGDPQATITKMQQIKRAANAPAHPSSQDRAVAAQAAATEQQARTELAQQRSEQQTGPNSAGPTKGKPLTGKPSTPHPITTSYATTTNRPSGSLLDLVV